MKVLVTGGVRSGKSRHAEELLAGRDDVVYVAAGPVVDDADWAARIAAHRARRPATWATLETCDLAAALARPEAVLVDCLGTWLTGVLDERSLWESPVEQVTGVVQELVDAAAARLRGRDDAVLVTNEVGLGVVPAHRSGRLFRDLLGSVNQAFGAACDEVHLVVAGRVLVL
ncbi:bifunctional adenosylcobinamide kinase/adenosylcobinamide-phosphate guanylyltransferase [Nocardioides sp. DS6]|uniref:Adenosylcobinamide kinase n=1 Tax=Nocardioides eburneus TaxID=3231482 RepID=A0ABV3T5E0_9ACTN